MTTHTHNEPTITIRVMQYPMPSAAFDEDEDGAYCGTTWREVDCAFTTATSAKRIRAQFRRKYRGPQFAIIG